MVPAYFKSYSCYYLYSIKVYIDTDKTIEAVFLLISNVSISPTRMWQKMWQKLEHLKQFCKKNFFMYIQNATTQADTAWYVYYLSTSRVLYLFISD